MKIFKEIKTLFCYLHIIYKNDMNNVKQLDNQRITILNKNSFISWFLWKETFKVLDFIYNETQRKFFINLSHFLTKNSIICKKKNLKYNYINLSRNNLWFETKDILQKNSIELTEHEASELFYLFSIKGYLEKTNTKEKINMQEDILHTYYINPFIPIMDLYPYTKYAEKYLTRQGFQKTSTSWKYFCMHLTPYILKKILKQYQGKIKEGPSIHLIYSKYNYDPELLNLLETRGVNFSKEFAIYRSKNSNTQYSMLFTQSAKDMEDILKSYNLKFYNAIIIGRKLNQCNQTKKIILESIQKNHYIKNHKLSQKVM